MSLRLRAGSPQHLKSSVISIETWGGFTPKQDFWLLWEKEGRPTWPRLDGWLTLCRPDPGGPAAPDPTGVGGWPCLSESSETEASPAESCSPAPTPRGPERSHTEYYLPQATCSESPRLPPHTQFPPVPGPSRVPFPRVVSCPPARCPPHPASKLPRKGAVQMRIWGAPDSAPALAGHSRPLSTGQ